MPRFPPSLNGLEDMGAALEESLWIKVNLTGELESIHFMMRRIPVTVECAGDMTSLRSWLLWPSFFVRALFLYAILEAGESLYIVYSCIHSLNLTFKS